MLQSGSEWTCSDTERLLTANGIPDHEVIIFPNDGNPNTISEQIVSASFTPLPTATDTATELSGPAGTTGYVLNGVKIDASTAGSCDDSGENCSLIDNSGGWSIEALTQTSFNFGTDDNNAQISPSHYENEKLTRPANVGRTVPSMTVISLLSAEVSMTNSVPSIAALT